MRVSLARTTEMSATLVEKLGNPTVRPQVVADCVGLIDAQVKTKGFVIKSAYATIKALKKRMIPEVVDALLDDWLGKLQPHYDKWQANKATPFSRSEERRVGKAGRTRRT